MHKRAGLSDWIDVTNPAIVAGLGLTTTLIAPKVIDAATKYGYNMIHKGINKAIEEDRVDKDSTSKILQRAKEFGGLSDIPHEVIDGIGNAAYIPPRSINENVEIGLRKKRKKLLEENTPKSLGMAKFLDQSMKFSKKKNGGIIIGKKFDNPAIVAHELGHALIDKQGGFTKKIQDYSRPVKNVGSAVASLGLLGMGAKFLGNSLSNYMGKGDVITTDVADHLFWGGLASYGVGALGELYKEHLASEKARDILKKENLMTPQREKLLNMALGTYALGSANTAAKHLTFKTFPGALL